MRNAIGSWYPARSLSGIEPVGPLTLGRFLVLVSLGLLTIVLHETFRYPLNLPGRHGLESMALLVFGRLICTDRWAGTVVATSTAAAGIAFTGSLNDGWSAPFLDFLPGFALDLMVMAAPALRRHVYLLPFAVAACFALKPVFKAAGAELLGLQFGSLRHGPIYPVLTHLMYGYLGAFAGVFGWSQWDKRSQRAKGV